MSEYKEDWWGGGVSEHLFFDSLGRGVGVEKPRIK